MGELVLIEQVKNEKIREERERLVSGLESLVERAKAGEIIAVCFAAIPGHRQSITVGALKMDECGTHELVGASSMLADHIAGAARG